MKRLIATFVLLFSLLSLFASPAAAYTFPPIIQVPSPNFDAGRDGYTIDHIILHTTEGSFDSAVGWLSNPASGGSAQYIVNADGTRLIQLVQDKDTSWGAGNIEYNRRSINIEQEGYASRGGFSDGLYETVGQLVGRLALTYHIPLDRQHVIGHMNVPDPNHPDQFGGGSHHNDPGPYYDFDKVLTIAQAYEDSQSPAQAEPCTYYPQTGFSACYGFRAFYDSFGDNAVGLFGYPISSEFQINGVTMQYFERARFEWHPDTPGYPNNPYHVQLGLIGTENFTTGGN